MLLCPWEFSRQEYWSEFPCPSPGDLPNLGIEPRSLALKADSLSSEPPRKPKNIGMGSLFLLQGIFLTQESNQGFLHHRQTLYPLSHQGSNAGDPSSIPGSGRSPGDGIHYPLQYSWASLVAQIVKNLPAMWETWVRSLGWEDPWRRERLPTPVFWP